MLQGEGVEAGKQDNGSEKSWVSHSCHFALSPSPHNTHTSVIGKTWVEDSQRATAWIYSKGSGQDTHTPPIPPSQTTAPGAQTSTTFPSTSHTHPHHLQLPLLSSDLQAYYYKKKKILHIKFILLYMKFILLSIYCPYV